MRPSFTENMEAGRLTENILPPDVLLQILSTVARDQARLVEPIQWYYENTMIIPIWMEPQLIYQARLPMVDAIPCHHISFNTWPVPHRQWKATLLLPPVVLRDTITGDLDVSPSCHGYRPRVCRRGLNF